MEWLTELYPEVRQHLANAVPDYWPALQELINPTLKGQLMSGAILPLAACAAVGGTARTAVPVSASLIASAVSARIFDDLQDKDRPNQLWRRVGETRAWNYGMAMYGLAFRILNQSNLPGDTFRQINQLYLDAFFYMAAGQERDLLGATLTVDDYWKTIALKTGTAYAVACAAGAAAGTDDPELIQACHAFGHHVGIIIQIFNDYESIWQPDGLSDIALGKVTLPIIYALQSDHPKRDALSAWIQTGKMGANAKQIIQMLDDLDTKAFMVWAAIKEREQALAAITQCSDNVGRAALIGFVTGMFGDIDALVD